MTRVPAVRFAAMSLVALSIQPKSGSPVAVDEQRDHDDDRVGPWDGVGVVGASRAGGRREPVGRGTRRGAPRRGTAPGQR